MTKAVRLLTGRVSRPPVLELAYVVLLDDEVHNFIGRLQLAILDACGRGPVFHAVPHITLKLGFKVAHVEPFARYLDTLADSIGGFDICLRHLATFDEGVVYLAVEDNPSLERVRRRMLDDLSTRYGIVPHPIEDARFLFHATIAAGLSRAQIDALRPRLAEPTPRFCFRPDTLAMLCHTGDQWITGRKATLPHARTVMEKAPGP